MAISLCFKQQCLWKYRQANPGHRDEHELNVCCTCCIYRGPNNTWRMEPMNLPLMMMHLDKVEVPPTVAASEIARVMTVKLAWMIQDRCWTTCKEERGLQADTSDLPALSGWSLAPLGSDNILALVPEGTVPSVIQDAAKRRVKGIQNDTPTWVYSILNFGGAVFDNLYMAVYTWRGPSGFWGWRESSGEEIDGCGRHRGVYDL
eukprot:symbB.v1.2.003274.t1/scaffold184.1/size280901/2